MWAEFFGKINNFIQAMKKLPPVYKVIGVA
jgi:hypothetical protein